MSAPAAWISDICLYGDCDCDMPGCACECHGPEGCDHDHGPSGSPGAAMARGAGIGLLYSGPGTSRAARKRGKSATDVPISRRRQYGLRALERGSSKLLEG